MRVRGGALRTPPLLALVALAAVAGSAGCGGKDTQPPVGAGGAPAKSEPEKAAPPAPVATTAIVEGSVRLAGGTELPSYPSERMEKKVLEHTQHAALPETCTPPQTTDRQPVQVTPDGLLTNVVVAASNFSKQPQRAPLTHDVLIDDCRLKPAVVVAMKGDTLRVRNALNYPFMPTYGQTPVVRTLIKGQTYEVKLDQPGVAPLLCGFTAPCGRSDVVVLLHPVHAATDAQGKFKIENFPAGETLKLSAWHPLFKESAIDVRAEPGEVKRVELMLTPLPSAATPTEEEQPGAGAEQPEGKAPKKAGKKGARAAKGKATAQ
jgi:hypothetical protein